MRSILGFVRDDRGSQTIEFMLWIPIFVGLLIIVMDATTLYITQTEMENVARDTARRMVNGLSPALAEQHALNEMRLRNYPYSVTATFDPAIGADVTIAIQSAAIGIMGYLNPVWINSAVIAARVVMRPDPTVNYGGGNGNGNGNGNGGT